MKKFITEKSIWPIAGGAWGLLSWLYLASNASKYFDIFGTNEFIFPLSFKILAFPVWILVQLENKFPPDFLAQLPEIADMAIGISLSIIVGVFIGFSVFVMKSEIKKYCGLPLRR